VVHGAIIAAEVLIGNGAPVLPSPVLAPPGLLTAVAADIPRVH
jgi:carbonic anhydrase/acetyltransferase-like protein (isoleucine patch superfamily)